MTALPHTGRAWPAAPHKGRLSRSWLFTTEGFSITRKISSRTRCLSPETSLRRSGSRRGQGQSRCRATAGMALTAAYLVSRLASTAPPVMPALSPRLEAMISTPFTVPGMA